MAEQKKLDFASVASIAEDFTPSVVALNPEIEEWMPQPKFKVTTDEFVPSAFKLDDDDCVFKLKIK